MHRFLFIVLTLIAISGYVGYAQTTLAPIWAPVFTSKNTVGTSANIKNNGQSQHTLYVAYVNGTGTCDATKVLIPSFQIEGAYSSSGPFVPISLVMTSDGALQFYGFGYGSFPFLRVKYLTADVACSATVTYTGNVATMSVPQSVQTTGLGYKRALVVIPDASITSVISAATFPTSKIVIHGILITFNNILAVSGNMFIREYTGSNCSTGPGDEVLNYSIVSTATSPNPQPFIMDRNPIPFWKALVAGSTVCMFTDTGIQAVITVWYRLE